MHTYVIDGVTYHQRPLVLGQLEQLITTLDSLQLYDFTAAGIVTALGPRLSRALAVVLIPDGQSVRDRNLGDITEQIANGCDLDTAIQVVADFFTCNPVASYVERLTGMAETARASLTG
jgi:hypothetical protein